MNKITNFLKILSDKIRYFIIFDIVYYLVLIAYDFLVYKLPQEELLKSYLSIIFMCAVTFIGMYFVNWLQLKNSHSTEKSLNLMSLFFLIVSTLILIVLSVQYFLEGFFEVSFITPLLILGVLFSLRTRFKKYDK